MQSRAVPFTWAQLESTNYYTYVKNLRAVDCPEETIADIITADVRVLFRKKREQTRAEGTQPAQVSADLATIDAQEREALAALGLALPNDTPAFQFLPAASASGEDGIPESKRELIVAWEREWQSQRNLFLQGLGDRQANSDEIEALTQLDVKWDRQLGEILTPEEREEFDMHYQPAALALRESLANTEVTDEEFRSLYQLRKRFEMLTSGEGLRHDSQALARLEDDLQQLLGPDRFAAFKDGADRP